MKQAEKENLVYTWLGDNRLCIACAKIAKKIEEGERWSVDYCICCGIVGDFMSHTRIEGNIYCLDCARSKFVNSGDMTLEDFSKHHTLEILLEKRERKRREEIKKKSEHNEKLMGKKRDKGVKCVKCGSNDRLGDYDSVIYCYNCARKKYVDSGQMTGQELSEHIKRYRKNSEINDFLKILPFLLIMFGVGIYLIFFLRWNTRVCVDIECWNQPSGLITLGIVLCCLSTLFIIALISDIKNK